MSRRRSVLTAILWILALLVVAAQLYYHDYVALAIVAVGSVTLGLLFVTRRVRRRQIAAATRRKDAR